MIPRKFRTLMICAGLIAGCFAMALAADTITGVARNQTDGRFAAGDVVVLLCPGRNMQEETRTRTNSQGSFTLKVRYPDAPHLVRILHQGINYDQVASAGDAVSIDVFDAAAKVQGVTGSIEIIRVGTNGNFLHVSDMVEIKNESSPPLTQASERTFEVYLSAQAKFDSVLAAGSGAGSRAGSGKIGMMISAAPVPGEPGHYTVNFPLRPGTTKFAFNYNLPYDGRATFRIKSMYPLQQLAVMIPPTMKFKSLSSAFQVLHTGNDSYQVEAVNQVKAGVRPEFEILGTGAFPALPVQAESESPPKLPVVPLPTVPSVSDNSRARTQLQDANILRTVPAAALPASSSGFQWWVVGAGAVLLIGACGFFLWRKLRVSTNAITTDVQKTQQRGQTSALLIAAFEEELSHLEVERLHGTISVEEYASAKQALEGTVKRASARAGAEAAQLQPDGLSVRTTR
jgi:hypothetical protein